MSCKVIIPISPYQPLYQEPSFFKFYTQGGTITGIDAQLGYNHRGAEKISEEKSFEQAAFLAERICGVSSVAHSLAYSIAVEDILGVEPPERAQYIRTAMAEIERINSHLLSLGLTAHKLGYETLFISALNLRRPLLDVLENITGNSFHYGMIKPGGVRRDIKPEDLPKIIKAVSDLIPAIDMLKKKLLGNFLICRRLSGLGVVKKQDAAACAAVGPVARASGLDIDARKNDVYAAYAGLEWKTISRQEGDALARTTVRILELYESADIIKQCLKKMPKGPVDVKIKEVPGGEGIGITEAPDGECLHYVRSDGLNSPVRHKIRPAAYMNIPAAKSAVLGERIQDAAVILASLDLCYSCAER